VHEKCVIGSGAQDSALDLIVGIPADVAVDNEEFSIVDVVYSQAFEGVIAGFGDGHVDTPPPNFFGCVLVLHDPLVGGHASSSFSGVSDYRPVRRQLRRLRFRVPRIIRNRVFVQLSHTQVVKYVLRQVQHLRFQNRVVFQNAESFL